MKSYSSNESGGMKNPTLLTTIGKTIPKSLSFLIIVKT